LKRGKSNEQEGEEIENKKKTEKGNRGRKKERVRDRRIN
jgi:hypothetical protein